MYKHLIAATILMFALAGGPSLVGAQGVQDGINNQVPMNNNTGQTSGIIDSRDEGFDWRWLLPLLAIPFILLLK